MSGKSNPNMNNRNLDLGYDSSYPKTFKLLTIDAGRIGFEIIKLKVE